MERYYITSNKYSLQERKLKNGKKVYDIVFRIYEMDGTARQKWLRRYETKKLAEYGYMDYVSKHCELIRHQPRKKKDPNKEVLYVGDLFNAYLASLGNQNKQSVIYDKQHTFDLYILPTFKDKSIYKITKEELYQWQDKLWNTKNSRTGAYFSHKYLMKIRSFFNAFLEWCEQRYGVKNLLSEVTKPKRRQPQRKMSFWTKNQFEQFISVVDDDMYHALFTFMFYTGRRKGELFALFKTDVGHDKITFDKSVSRKTYGLKSWEITSTKADKEATVPVCGIVQDEIKRYKPPKEGKFYFGGKKPLAENSVARAFKKYTEIAGLPPIRIHDLRHSFVSMVIHLGGNLMVVADLISDTVEQVTKTYGHLYQEDKLDIISKIK